MVIPNALLLIIDIPIQKSLKMNFRSSPLDWSRQNKVDRLMGGILIIERFLFIIANWRGFFLGS